MGQRVLFLPDYGDANPYQPLLARALTDRGFTVSVASGGGVFPVLGAYYRHRRPSVVHLHWLHPYLVGRGPLTTLLKGARFLVELSVLRLLGVTLVWTIHNQLEHDRRAPRVEVLLKHAVLWLVGAGIVHCDAAASLLTETYRLRPTQQSKLKVVPHGHYIDWYPATGTKSSARRALGLDDDTTVFLYFGRVQPYKNLSRLVEAFRAVGSQQARLLLVGSPSDDALAASLTDASADDDRIRLVFEYVPDADVPRYFTAADAVVLPYRDVLTSGTAILAASFRRALIAPRRGCLAEQFDDGTGLIYEPDGAGLGGALERALRHDLDRIGRRHFDRVREADWPTVAGQTAAVYAAAGGDPRAR
jgi:glycosyltransferase involved in cell wall biosynthesis